MVTGTPVNLPCGCPEDQAAVARSAASARLFIPRGYDDIAEALVTSSAPITSSMTSTGVNRPVR